MPTLPTLTVTTAQEQRIATACGDVGDGVAYKAWLKQAIINMVQTYEAEQLNSQWQANVASNYQNVQSDIGTAS